MVVIKSKRSMNLSYRQMRVLEMHLFCAGSVGQPVHGHFDHLDTRVVDPRHALFVQANVIDHVGRGHGKRILQSPQRHKPVRWGPLDLARPTFPSLWPVWACNHVRSVVYEWQLSAASFISRTGGGCNMSVI